MTQALHPSLPKPMTSSTTPQRTILFLGVQGATALSFGIPRSLQRVFSPDTSSTTISLALSGSSTLMKVDPERWEFANEGFLRGRKQLLKNIRRKATQPQASQQPQDACVEVGRFGLDGEVDWLRRDKQVLMAELVKLRQEQQNTRTYLQSMEDRLRKTERKQHQTMNFLARAMQNPNFLQQLVQQKNRRKELEAAISKKRRRPIDQGGGGTFVVKVEPQDSSGMSELEVSELDRSLGINMQKNPLEELIENGDQEHDEGFWENLLNENIEEEIVLWPGLEQEDDDEEDHVDVLAEQLDDLASTSN